ncbi:MAG TPA: hypothetical protein VMT46_19105 [Anaerolineaceae bacterium]|nr:hypothetical protein [Anaerolineaceae bacterium]
MNRQKILLYLYSNANITGSLLGLLGLALYFLGIIQSYWFLIVVGLYAIGALAAPRSASYDLSLQNQLTAEDIRGELEELVRKVHGKLPKEIMEKVESIQSSILQVLPQMVDLSSSDYNVYLIKQTALDYLPASLEYYLNLPPAYANLHSGKDGKTPRQLVLEQLTLLDEEMKGVVEAVYKNDTQKLMVQGQFLKEKFQKSSLVV